MRRYRAKRLITVRRGESTYTFTVEDLALIMYMALIAIVLSFGFILLFESKVIEAQSLFTFFSGIGVAEVIEKLRRWKEEAEEDEES